MEKFLVKSQSNPSLATKRAGDDEISNPNEWKIPKRVVHHVTQQKPVRLITSNRFSGLSSSRTPCDSAAARLRDATSVKPAAGKIPPIFLETNPEWTHEYVRTIISRYTKQYHLKYTGNNKIAANCHNAEAHHSLKEGLRSENVPFHTFSRKDERTSKLVILGLPAYAEDSLVEELATLGFNGVTVRRLKSANGLNASSPPFLVHLPAGADIASFKQIKYLSQCAVQVRRFRPNNNNGTQCYRCQFFGHSSRNCNLPPRCVKCEGSHLTRDCCKKDQNEPARCCNCGENHPANYRNCKERQKYLHELQNRRKDQKKIQTSKAKMATTDGRSWSAVAANKGKKETSASDEEKKLNQATRDNTTEEMIQILMTIKSLKGQFAACSSMMDKVVLILTHLGQYV